MSVEDGRPICGLKREERGKKKKLQKETGCAGVWGWSREGTDQTRDQDSLLHRCSLRGAGHPGQLGGADCATSVLHRLQSLPLPCWTLGRI
jgi:hypothetical protein